VVEPVVLPVVPLVVVPVVVPVVLPVVLPVVVPPVVVLVVPPVVPPVVVLVVLPVVPPVVDPALEPAEVLVVPVVAPPVLAFVPVLPAVCPEEPLFCGGATSNDPPSPAHPMTTAAAATQATCHACFRNFMISPSSTSLAAWSISDAWLVQPDGGVRAYEAGFRSDGSTFTSKNTGCL